MEVHFKLFGTDGVSLQSQELTRRCESEDGRSTLARQTFPRKPMAFGCPSSPINPMTPSRCGEFCSRPVQMMIEHRLIFWSRSNVVPRGSDKVSKTTSTSTVFDWFTSAT